MQYSARRLLRPQALVGILITTLGLLSFQAVCDIFSPVNQPSAINCSGFYQFKSRIIDAHVASKGSLTHDDVILAAILELSNSISQMNASLTSLHAQLAQSPVISTNAHPGEQPKSASTQTWLVKNSATEMSPQESQFVCSIIPAIMFLIGILVFIEDASHVSQSFVRRCALVMMAMANIGLATVLLGSTYSGWERYVYGTAWPVVLAMVGLALQEAVHRRNQLGAESEKCVKGG